MDFLQELTVKNKKVRDSYQNIKRMMLLLLLLLLQSI